MLSKDRQTKTAISVEKVTSVSLHTFPEGDRGSLTVLQSDRDVPFPIARLFYIYGVAKDCERGAHAHRETSQAFVAIVGSFSLEVTDGCRTKTFVLKEPHRAVYVPPMIWARLHTFSDDAVCLVLTSSSYDPADYIREWKEYLSTVKQA